MESNNLRPASLGAVVGSQNLGSDIRKRANRANALRGLISSDAQTT